jgi:two-component system chemotaxis response regulator CheV
MAVLLGGPETDTAAAARNHIELLLFRLGGRQRFGIDVLQVQEVIQCPPLVAVPQSHPAVLGIANLRGKTIAIMDLAQAIGAAPIARPHDKYVIVTDCATRVQGFLVDSVDRIVDLQREHVRPPPRGIGRNAHLAAVTQVEQELVEVIDAERLLI